jgi:hypothetical protein
LQLPSKVQPTTLLIANAHRGNPTAAIVSLTNPVLTLLACYLYLSIILSNNSKRYIRFVVLCKYLCYKRQRMCSKTRGSTSTTVDPLVTVKKSRSWREGFYYKVSGSRSLPCVVPHRIFSRYSCHCLLI